MMKKMSKVDHLPRYGMFIVLALIVIGYSLFQARFLILGPRVSISYPGDGAVTETEIITLQGTAENVAWITLNGRQIYTNEEGAWSEELVLSKGLSVATVEARDKFGRQVEKRVRIYLN